MSLTEARAECEWYEEVMEQTGLTSYPENPEHRRWRCLQRSVSGRTVCERQCVCVCVCVCVRGVSSASDTWTNSRVNATFLILEYNLKLSLKTFNWWFIGLIFEYVSHPCVQLKSRSYGVLKSISFAVCNLAINLALHQASLFCFITERWWCEESVVKIIFFHNIRAIQFEPFVVCSSFYRGMLL